MNPIRLEDQDSQFLIHIDKDTIEKETLLALLDSIRVEDLSKRADFGEDVVQLGEEVKADWWANNKLRWIKDVASPQRLHSPSR